MADKTISEKVWGFHYTTLTFKGIADLMFDLLKIIISILLVWNYPYSFSNASGEINTSPVTWIGTVLLLAVITYIFLPSFSRVLFGRYEHWVRTENNNNNEGEQNNV